MFDESNGSRVCAALDRMIELTRDICSVDPVLQACDMPSGDQQICIRVDLGPNADADEVARLEAEWNDRVASIADPDVFLMVEYGIPDR